MGLKDVVASALNTPLRWAGGRLVPTRDYVQFEGYRASVGRALTFTAGRATFECFAHRFNCGWPYLPTVTERTVELAVADRWLSERPADTVTEIGAVTPYYWPRRVADVVDPTDPHPQVARKAGLADVSLAGRAVLSISTFEHIGIGDYGLAKDAPAAAKAVDKLLAEAGDFLITFGAGYNPGLDQHVLSVTAWPAGVQTRLVVRDPSGVGWAEKPFTSESLRPYGSAGANAVFILARGTGVFDG